jgi:ATP phosphoribosyltransferase regulatory subunit
MDAVEKNRSMLPKGVATFLPEGAARRRAIESTVLTLFRRWGYQEVITPIFEYLDVLSEGIGEELLDRAFKFVDRSSGRIMILRPDVTPQIARMAATLLSRSPLPLRLCYSANVFRHEEEHAGRDREIHQMGVECIGFPGIEADAEMLMIAVETLRRLGVKGFKIAVGHAGFIRGLLEGIDDPGLLKRVLNAVARKDQTETETLLSNSGIPVKDRQAVISLPYQFGGEEALTEGMRLSRRPACKAALAELQETFSLLKASGCSEPLLVDLGEVRRLDYYTGIVFEIVVEGIGYELGGGGRYDRLPERFGYPVPSTGFALHMERLQAVLEKNNGVETYSSADLLLLYPKGCREEALKLAWRFREKGLRVICHSGAGGLKDQIDEAQRLRARYLAVCEERVKGKEILWVEIERKTRKRLDAKRLGEFLARGEFAG